MMRRFRIDHLEWDDWNREHATKHGIGTDEITEVLEGLTLVEESYKQRSVLIGSTAVGRIVTIVVGQVPGKPTTFYVFSARPASRRERRRFAAAAERSP